jgi:ATP-binding cassette subfamily C (CFTR/MRP) protein 1
MKKCSFSWTNKKANLKPIDDGASKKKKKERRGSNSSSSSVSVSRHSRYSNLSGSENAEDSGVDVETLSDISITIEPGELVAVVGTVGCGKSSFLSAILGEMEPMNDSKIYVPCEDKSGKSKMSYCCQSPWVVNDTLRGNVLFGREFEKDRYDAIIEACALVDDLAILPAGDKTEIGERGINLSGGQKVRIHSSFFCPCVKHSLIFFDVLEHVGPR